mgnify:CR=1 FL=1|jgi:hypothetical protein
MQEKIEKLQMQISNKDKELDELRNRSELD